MTKKTNLKRLLSVYCPDEIARQVEAAAKRENRNLSNQVVEILRHWVNKQKKAA